MITKGRLFLLPLLFFAGSAPASAQTLETIPDFSLLRVQSPVFTGTSTLLHVGSDSLRMGVEGTDQPISLPIASLTRLEYRRPATRLERATRGALWGGGSAAVLGLLIADRPEGTSAAEVAVGTFLLGAVWGGAIGLAIRQSRWERVELGSGRAIGSTAPPSSPRGSSSSPPSTIPVGPAPMPAEIRTGEAGA